MEVSTLRIFLKLTLLLMCSIQFMILFYRDALHVQQIEWTNEEATREPQTSYDNVILQELRQRSQEVSLKCKRNMASQKVVNGIRGTNTFFQNMKLISSLSQIVVIPEDKLAWCMVPKAASSSIAAAIVEVHKLTSLLEEEGQFQVFLRKFYKSKQLKTVGKEKNNFASFYITRHPFNRIVSAFRDKLENSSRHDGPYFYKVYGKGIVKNFGRPNDVHEKKTNREPTFKEFALYLINTVSLNYDLHWKPISILCDVCNYNYNFTIKFENFRSEFQTLLTFLKGEKYLPENFEIKWKNKGSDEGKTDKITRTYMKQIPRSYVKKLYKIYRADFVNFNYDVTGYL